MFNINKENTKDKVEDLVNKSETLINDASDTIKSKTKQISLAVDEKSDQARHEANELVASLKDLINAYSDKSKMSQLKERISETATGLKTVVCNEVSHAYSTSKQKTTNAIKENPLSSLALVAGASLALGYIFGTRKSDR